jgi:hypothetical protein
MQDIKDLAFLIKEHNLRPINSAGVPFDSHSKIGAFFDLIVSGKIDTDEDAKRRLYGNEEDSSKFRKLKSDFRNRLLNTLFHLNNPADEYSDYQRAYYDAHKQWMFVKILAGHNSFRSAQYVAVRLLKQAMLFEFTNLAMEATSFLRIQYALHEATDKKYNETNELFKHYRLIYDAECLAEERYTVLVAKHINSRAPKPDSVQVADQYYQELNESMKLYDSYRLHLYGRLIHFFKYLLEFDYKSSLQVCDDAIQFFSTKPFETRVPLQIFYYQKLICNIQLRQFEEGQNTAKICNIYLKEGTFNWFKYKELYLRLLFHTSRYELAIELIAEIFRHPRFQFLPENVKEVWRIYEAYIHYVAIQTKLAVPSGHQFKLGKFINETPIYARDKSGMNVAILIIKTLFLILEKKQARLVDEAESIEQYCYRYVRSPQTKRSFHFIKMLLLVSECGFDLPAIDKKARGHLDQLTNLQVNAVNQANEIEIILYEELWEMIRNALSAGVVQHRLVVVGGQE